MDTVTPHVTSRMRLRQLCALLTAVAVIASLAALPGDAVA